MKTPAVFRATATWESSGRRRRIVAAVAVLLATSLCMWWVWPEPPSESPASSQITVDQTTLSFDPQTCTEGKAHFSWAMGSCAVKILGHERNQCVFEYTQEVEMGATVYLVKVPVNSGPVTVKIDRVTAGTSTYDWPVTSFPLDQAKVVKQSGIGR